MPKRMDRVQCDACEQLFMVDPFKQRGAGGLRCPHCLTPVAIENRGEFSDYVPQSVSADARSGSLKISKQAQIIWTVFGTLFLVCAVALAIAVIASGYPYSSPAGLDTGAKTSKSDTQQSDTER